LNEHPTPATVCQAATASNTDDELLAWLPDLFAVTEVLLERSAPYRLETSFQ
jgi:hypothetical protein